MTMAAPSATTALILCILTLVCNILSTPSNANPEVDALIDVKKMILRDPLNALQTWDPSSTNPCNWMHVICDGENHVHSVELESKQLDGALSPRITELQNLEYLTLYNNYFFGTIPPTLGNLRKLHVLYLSNNYFSGSIPPSLGKINTLQVLHLQNNKLRGRFPTDGSLSKFGYPSFSGNPDLCGPIVQRECPKRSLDP